MKYRRIYADNNLVAYECEKGRIDVYDYDITPSGNWHRDYFVNGVRFSSLKKAKEFCEGDAEKN